MHYSWLLIKCIQFDLLVILANLKQSDASYLIPRNRGKSENYSNERKIEDSSSNVRTVGEVFVPKTFSINSQEPSCEELRAMWIFSRRQSRAAEITNEIPTYRDPFKYNIWEPLYLNPRMLGAVRMGSRERPQSPVFGRVVSREPTASHRSPFDQHQRAFDFGLGSSGLIQTRFYGAEIRPPNGASSSRRSSKNRYMGVPNGTGTSIKENQNYVPVQGSFQKLKELIWTERAKELTQQRRDEELAARVAALKEIANGRNVKSPYYSKSTASSDSILMDENRSPDENYNQYSGTNRMHILSGQHHQNVKNNRNMPQADFPASIRRIGNFPSSEIKTEKSNKEIKGSAAGYYVGDLPNNRFRIQIPSAYILSNEREQSVIGIPRKYPMRKSHFRERNRSLIREEVNIFIALQEALQHLLRRN
ncbi:uncharacterized protein Dana_GF15912, isoform C [Drosophila ananassae]|uniref:Uncharacterized protein, isoform C n=1 Tax=Drosophila ananassae TaxID=7217 RepID=A0A0P8Y7S4_DROAN|nr:uncharacterized protein Dana_GF15912, isoform C [Drosophila ananassae]